MSRLRRSICSVCGQGFVDTRNRKYCTAKCSEEAAKKQRAAWERKAKRPPHLYRKKKPVIDTQQLELKL